MNLGYVTSLSLYIPELIAIAFMVLMLFAIAFTDEKEGGQTFHSLINFALCVVLVALVKNIGRPSGFIFFDAVTFDSFGTIAKIVLVLGTMGAIFLARDSKDIDGGSKAEFSIMALGVMIGGMLLISANNFLTLYLGVETLSILSYALASFNKNDDRSSEAGLKYALYGAVSAGVMLFGMAHIFGVFGSVEFNVLGPKLAKLTSAELMIILPSFLFIFVGLGYKIAAVPFHMWSPDVYEGSPFPVTTLFAIVPKVAGLAALMRVSMVFFAHPGVLSNAWGGLITVIAALTMTVGNVSAVNQRSVKRMLAYSSISHSGFMIAAILTVTDIGTRALLFYAMTYLFMTLVAFYIASYVADMYGNDHFERFSGLIKRYPLMAIAMTITMFSLAGVPPLAGFVAKFNVLAALVNKGNYTLALVAVINSVVSLYYYLKIVRLMVFKEPESHEGITGFSFKNQTVVTIVTLPIVVLGIYWNELLLLAKGATMLVINR